MSFLENFECFSSSLELNLKGKTAFSSKSSLTFSLIFYVLWGLVVYFNVNKYIHFNEPTVVGTETSHNFSETTNVRQDEFQISTMVTDANLEIYTVEPQTVITEIVYDNSEFDPSNTYINPSIRQVGRLENCENSEVSKSINSKFSALVSAAKCTAFSSDFLIGGSALTGTKQASVNFSLEVNACDKYPSLCQEEPDTSDIDFSTTPLELSIGYRILQPDMNQKSGSSPTTRFILPEIFPFYNYKFVFKVRKMKVVTDPNAIFYFLNDQQEEFLTISQVDKYQIIKQIDGTIGLFFEFEVETVDFEFSRSYNKVDDVLANVQAVSDILGIVLGFGLKFFNEGLVNTFIAENMYFAKGTKEGSIIRETKQSVSKLEIEEKLVLKRSIWDTIKMGFGFSPNKRLSAAFEMAEEDTDFLGLLARIRKLEQIGEEDKKSANVESSERETSKFVITKRN